MRTGDGTISASRTRRKKHSQPTDTDKLDVSGKMWNTSVAHTRASESAANMTTLIKCQHNEASKNKKYWILIYPHLLGSGFFSPCLLLSIPAVSFLYAHLLGWRWCVCWFFTAWPKNGFSFVSLLWLHFASVCRDMAAPFPATPLLKLIGFLGHHPRDENCVWWRVVCSAP